VLTIAPRRLERTGSRMALQDGTAVTYSQSLVRLLEPQNSDHLETE